MTTILLRFLACSLCTVAFSLNAQIVSDDFSDGDFTQGTVWFGTADDFIVNASNRLQLNAAAAGQSHLATAFTETSLDNREWNIWVRHQFAGSGNNFTRIYLSSLSGDLSFSGSSSAGANGYFLLLGEPGPDDAIRLFRDGEAGTAPVEIAAGSAGLVAQTFIIRIRVVRDAIGNWTIFADPNGGDQYLFEGSGFDNTFNTSSHLGMVCTYTAGNVTNFQFGDVFFGDEIVDEDPPVIENLFVTAPDQLQLFFNEAIDASSAANTANYNVDGGVGQPLSAALIGGNPFGVELHFADDFPPDTELTLTVSGVEDLAGNPNTTVQLPFISNVSSAIVEDDFSDGDFTTNPTWEGTTADFTVNSLQRLQLNAANAGQSYLSTAYTPQSLAEKEWNIWVKHDFSGSGSNNTRIYLSSITPVLNHSGSSSAGALGYYLLMGEAGPDDAIRLMRDGEAGTAPVQVAVGSAGLVAEPFEIRIRVVRDALGNWSIFAAPDGGTGYLFEGQGFDNTYTVSGHFGILCNYTASNVDRFQFDDVYFGPIIPDVTPPEVLSASAEGENTLNLLFNEPLDAATAQNPSFYSVSDGVGAPTSAVVSLDNPAAVTLNFAGAFLPNTFLTLTVTGVEDLAGNTADGATAQFIYIIPIEPNPGDIVINEMLVRATPPIGLPPYEFVELFNASENVYDLAGWEFVNTTTARTLPSYPLFPGEYVVLTSNEGVEQLSLFGDVIGINPWLTLTNAADSLTLISPDQIVVDIVSYTDQWYGNPLLANGGVTLERINPFAPCSGSNNWQGAQTFTGGTPNAQNSVFDPTPDTTPPQLVGHTFFGDNGVLVHFNEPLDPEILAGALDYLLQPDLGEASLALLNNNETLRLVFDEPFEPGVSYTLTLIGVADCSGNTSLDPIEITLIKGWAPEFGELIINEILVRTSSTVPSPEAEYVELYNRGERLLDLSGIRLENGTMNGQPLVESGGYAVLTREAEVNEFEGYDVATLIPVSGFPQLTNAGRTLRIFDTNNIVLDEVTYTDQWYRDDSKSNGGYSLERINPDHPCSDEDNWRASEAPVGHTAGAINSVFSLEPDFREPDLQYVFVSGVASLELIFDKQLDAISEQTVQVEVGILTSGGFTNLNYDVVSATFIDDGNRSLLVTFSGGFSAGVLYECRVSGIQDCWGTTVPADSSIDERFAVPEPHEAGDLIINEILFNPFADGGTDYVEIVNVSNRNIGLQGWQLANEATGTVSNYRLVTDLPLVLFPGEYLVLTQRKSGVVPFYPDAREDRVVEMASLPAYNNGDGVVILADPENEVIDRVPYDEDMHFPLLRDVKGVSLERLDFFRDSEDETNWQSASEVVGFGTPGYENSQVSVAIPDGVLSITPEVFSPDNDGFDDQLLISYEMARDGFTGSIRIFDDLGRPVRRVAHNVLLGSSGTFSWDGFTDDRLKAGIGIYIVFFEAFHPDGEVIQEKAAAVLGHYLD